MTHIIIFKQKTQRVEASDSTSEVLIERDSLRVLYDNNSHEKRGIASLTKILTAIVAIEKCDIKKEVVITDKMVGIEGSSVYLQAGEKLTVEELLYALMLRSGNDAAVAIALSVSGSIESFAELMNDTARKAGAYDSYFVNPHGLDNDNHYSTAYDMALITAYALKNPVFAKIVDTEKINISNDFYGYDRVLINKNKLLKVEEGFDGVKTGYTKKCGRCLVASKTVDDMQLISVVLNCGPMFERCEALLNDGFARFERVKILDKEKVYDLVDLGLYQGIKLPVSVKNDVYYPMLEGEKKNLSYEIVYDKKPSRSDIGENIGKINVYSEKDLIYSAESFIIIPQEGC